MKLQFYFSKGNLNGIIYLKGNDYLNGIGTKKNERGLVTWSICVANALTNEEMNSIDLLSGLSNRPKKCKLPISSHSYSHSLCFFFILFSVLSYQSVFMFYLAFIIDFLLCSMLFIFFISLLCIYWRKRVLGRVG